MWQDENTRYVCIGPVNKVINMLCCWLENPDSEAFKRCCPVCLKSFAMTLDEIIKQHQSLVVLSAMYILVVGIVP